MKMGILGAGYIARKMAYTVSQMEDAVCYAVAAREMSRAEQSAKKSGACSIHSNYDEIFLSTYLLEWHVFSSETFAYKSEEQIFHLRG